MTKRLFPVMSWLDDSPRANVIKVGIVVMGVEFAIMVFIEGMFQPLFGKNVSPLFWEFFDPILLSVIAAPVLQIWVLNPMKEQEKELRIAAVAFESQNGMLITDPKGLILRVNPAFVRMTGYKPEEVIGRTPAVLKSGRQDPLFYRTMWETLKENGYWYGEIWNQRKNGQIYPELLTITAVTDADGSVIHYIGDFSDISESKENEVEIRRLAYYDPLTNLPNRHLLEVLMAQAMVATKRNQTHGAILVINLGRSDLTNDAMDNQQWDQLLVEVAHCVRSTVRGNDTVARHSAAEFAVLLEDLDKEESVASARAEQIGEKLRFAIDALFGLSGNEYSCKLSIGATMFSPSDSFEVLLANAELALCEAKKSDQGATRFFNPAMRSL